MKNYTITVNGTAYQVTVEEGFAGAAAAAPAPAPAAAPAAGGVTITSPMPGKILGSSWHSCKTWSGYPASGSYEDGERDRSSSGRYRCQC
jgi:hypothetical protein